MDSPVDNTDLICCTPPDAVDAAGTAVTRSLTTDEPTVPPFAVPDGDSATPDPCANSSEYWLAIEPCMKSGLTTGPAASNSS